MPTNDTRGLWRGKTTPKYNGEAFNEIWIKGDLIHSENRYYIHPIANTVKVQGELGKLIVMHEVDPSTLGECTGLRDKNGKLIFEGDIVLAYYNPKEKTAIGVIRYGKFMDTDSLDDYGYLGWYIEVQGHCISILQPDTDGICIEVIGNIHDNPELLKGADKP